MSLLILPLMVLLYLCYRACVRRITCTLPAAGS